MQNAIQVIGSNNQFNNFDINAVRTLAQSLNATMYPHAERALAKLRMNANLIKILAFSFLFSRTKYMRLFNEELLIQKLASIAIEFNDPELSASKFEYLEAISCGKSMPFVSDELLRSIYKNYPQLFIKKISRQQIDTLGLSDDVKNILFVNDDADTGLLKVEPLVELYVFEDIHIQIHNRTVIIADLEKEKVKEFLSRNRLSENETKDSLMSIPGFDTILCNFL